LSNHREAVLVPDTSKDERWVRRADDETNRIAKSAICVPLIAREHWSAVLTLVHPDRMFLPEHLTHEKPLRTRPHCGIQCAFI